MHNQPTHQEDAEQSQETAYVKPSEHEGKFGIGDKMTFYVDGKPIEAEVVQGEDVDGVVVQTSERVNGHLINQYTREELDALTAPPQQANDNADVVSPKTPEAGTEVQNETGEEEKSPDELPAFDGDKFNETHPVDEIRQPQEEQKPKVENNAVDEASTSSKIPQDEGGEPDYTKVDPKTAWNSLLQQTEGDTDMAHDVASSMLEDAKSALQQAQQQTPKEGKTVSEKIQARKEHKEEVDRLQNEVNHWQEILKQSGKKEEVQVKEKATVTQQKQDNTNVFSGKYTLATESADNGEAFIQNEDGSTALIQIPKEIFDRIGINTMPFKMTASMALHVFNHHKKEGNFKTIDEAIDFVVSTIKNADHVRLGRDNTYIFSVENNRNKTGRRAIAVVVDSKSGKFLGVKTSGYEGLQKLKERPLLWERSAEPAPEDVATPTVTTIEPQQGDERTSRAKGQSNELSESKDTKSKAADKEKLDKLGKMGKAVDMNELPKDMAYRETDVNELEDILESGQLREIPDGKTVQGMRQIKTKDGRTLTFGKPKGNSNGGKGFAKGMIWTDGGGTLAGGSSKGRTKVIVGFPGNVTQWREGHHGSYSDAKNFDDIEHGSGLWLPFDENGAVSSLPVKDMKVWVEGEDGKFHEFTPNKPLSEQISTASAEVDTNPTEAQKPNEGSKKKEDLSDPLGGGVPDGKVPFHKAGESNRELTKAEVALRDAVVEVLRKSGIDVVTDVPEGQRVLDMANGKGEETRLMSVDERKERIEQINKIAPERVEDKPTTRKEARSAYADLKPVEKDGATVEFYNSAFGKAWHGEDCLFGKIIPKIREIFKSSVLAYSETDNLGGKLKPDGTTHKKHPNIKAFHNYVGKVIIGNKPYYVRFTVQEGTDAKQGTHNFFVSDISLYNNTVRNVTTDTNNTLGNTNTDGIVDAKLKNFFETSDGDGQKFSYHRVYHGSGADFDHFDHSHMGEGEGAQAYGWGTYVTEVEGIGRTYAISNTTKRNDALRALEHDIDAISAQLDMHRNELKNDEEQLKRANDWRAEAELDYELFQEKAEERKKEYGEDSPEYRNLLFNDIYTDEMKRAQRSVESTEDSIRYRKEKIAELEKALKDKQAEMGELPKKFPRHLYSVEIPEDNGKNYLDWNGRLSDSQIEAIRAYLSENYRRNKLEDFDASIAEVKDAPNADEVNAWARRGENVYKMLSHLLGSDEAASKALSEMGFVGIKYPAENRSGGRKDGAKNYVVFNEGDAEIVDKVRFFKTKDGEAYGFTVGGRIYIDPRIASSETAVHEYAHLWAEALRSANAKEWGNVVGLMRGTSVWNEVSERYPELKSDDEIADEVLATYSGRRGSERLREEMDRIKGSERSVADKARALGALERVKRALDRFWHGVADFLGIHYKSAEEVADRVMRDLLNGVDPRRFVRGESDGRVREQFVGEDGVSKSRGEQGRSLRGDEALTALNRIFDGEVKDELPPTIPTIEEFRQIFSKPIRTFLGELIKVKDNVYNKIQKEKRTRVSGAVMPTIKNADFAMRDTDGSTLYIKRFNNNTSDSTYNIAVVNKHGEVEDYISSVHIKRDANLRNKIKNGAELLLPNKRNGDGTVSRNNSTPDAKLGKISEKSDANGTLFRDDVDGVVSSSGVDGMRERAVELGRELGADVDVVSDVSEITDANPQVQERKRRAKGWYDAKTGRVVINLATHSDMADVEQTLLHEIVGHRGLRGLVGHENFNGFLDGIYEHASDGVREGIDDIARRKGCSKRVATEEYMSGLAEGGFADRKNAGLWQKIRQWFGDMLSRAKIKLNFEISDNELRYLLWRSHELSRMNGREGVVGRARDLAMQNRLGVGNGASKGGERAVDSYDGDLETLFRDADSPVDYERALIRDSYERRLKDVWFQSREALQDGMLSLKETMKDIWRSAGKKFSQITDIPDYANPYLGQNRLSSRNAAEVRDFKHNLFRPLLREVGRLTGFSADGRAKLTDYMMAKHGLERNKVMAERDAKHPNSLTCGP